MNENELEQFEELQDELIAANELAAHYQKNSDQKEKEAQVDRARREAAAEAIGITVWKAQNYEGPALPHLSNWNVDPSLSGKLIYHVPEGMEYSLGSAKDNNIVLVGLGI